MDKQKKSDRSKRPSLKSTLLELRRIMRERGWDEREIVEKYLIPRLSATKTIVAQRKGKVTDVLEVPDYAASLRAVEMCLQLHGAFPSTDSNGPEPKGHDSDRCASGAECRSD
jgi:hypothetical protein